MSPVVKGTGAMVLDSDKTIAALLKKRDAAVKNSDSYQVYVGDNGRGDEAKWEKYTNQPTFTTAASTSFHSFLRCSNSIDQA